MDKLLNKGKSKYLPQFKVPKTTGGQFWDLEVNMRSVRGQNAFFLT